MASDCVFCKISRGDLPCFKVYEDERSLAFLDINPVSPGHTLVIPKADGSRNICDISREDWASVAETARTVAQAVERAVAADGVNIMMNNRSHAGQVVDHPHIHIIPRFKGDGLAHWPHKKYGEGETEEILNKIVREIA